jgi:hypothetical protein
MPNVPMRRAPDPMWNIGEAVVEAVTAAGPCGVQGGVLYAFLGHSGCPRPQFETLMAALVAARRLRRDANRYFPVEVI